MALLSAAITRKLPMNPVWLFITMVEARASASPSKLDPSSIRKATRTHCQKGGQKDAGSVGQYHRHFLQFLLSSGSCQGYYAGDTGQTATALNGGRLELQQNGGMLTIKLDELQAYEAILFE